MIDNKYFVCRKCKHLVSEHDIITSNFFSAILALVTFGLIKKDHCWECMHGASGSDLVFKGCDCMIPYKKKKVSVDAIEIVRSPIMIFIIFLIFAIVYGIIVSVFGMW